MPVGQDAHWQSRLSPDAAHRGSPPQLVADSKAAAVRGGVRPQSLRSPRRSLRSRPLNSANVLARGLLELNSCLCCRFGDGRCIFSFMHLVHSALTPAPALPEIPIAVERRQLAKRLWRAIASDATAFGFDLASPLEHGDAVFATATALYVIRQLPEPVLEIPLPQSPEAAAVTGWAVGNLHFPIEAQPGRLLAPDDTALRQSLERMGIAYRAIEEVFRPHRLAAGAAPHSHAAGPEAHPFVFKTAATHV